jgi:hypothetical protein
MFEANKGSFEKNNIERHVQSIGVNALKLYGRTIGQQT